MMLRDAVGAVLSVGMVLVVGLGAIAVTACVLYGFAALWVLLVCR